MRVWIDQDLCTGSGLCELIEPRVFVIADDGLARVRQDDRVLPPGPGGAALVPDGCADRVREAGQSCPGGCIRVEDGDLPQTLGPGSSGLPLRPADSANSPDTAGRLRNRQVRTGGLGSAGGIN